MKKLSFKTPSKCEVFYFIYAKVVGFGVKKETWRVNHNYMVTLLRYLCDQEALRTEKNKNRVNKKRKQRDEIRYHC